MTRLSKDLERLIEEKSIAWERTFYGVNSNPLPDPGFSEGMRAGVRLGLEKAAVIADKRADRGGGIRDVTAHNLAIDILALVKDHDEVEARD